MLRTTILILSAVTLLAVAGLAWLVLRLPQGRLLRQTSFIAVALAPLVACVTFVVLAIPPPPEAHGRLTVTHVETLWVFAPWLALWLFACFVAYVVGKILKPGPGG
jgi:hypothetical protein